jgi:Na+-translocating ferredoxin:NAD+ oxidoreductase RnfC subunit
MHVPISGDVGDFSLIDGHGAHVAVVKRGNPLLGDVPDGSPLPHAPGEGRVAGLVESIIACSGRAMPTIAFDVVDREAGADESPSAVPQAEGDLARADATTSDLEAFGAAGLGEVAQCLARLGVWADRWASPDLLGQLRTKGNKPVDTIICNVLDEDPAVPLQVSVATAHAREIVGGLHALALAATHAGADADGGGDVEVQVLIVAGYDAPAETWDALRAAAGAAVDGAAGEVRLRIVPMQNAYPQPNPILLIHELTGRHVRWGESPAAHGVLVLDAAAAAAVGRALVAGEPMLETPIAIRDYVHARTHLAIAPLGMSIADALAQLGIGLTGVELRAGCPLRELRARPDCVFAGGELTISLSRPEARVNPDPCIRCAWCVEGCPVRIQPAGLLEAAQEDDMYAASQLGLSACIECGICSFVCPSHLPLLKGIRVLRSQIKTRKR